MKLISRWNLLLVKVRNGEGRGWKVASKARENIVAMSLIGAMTILLHEAG